MKTTTLATLVPVIALTAAAIIPAGAQVISGWVSSAAGTDNFAQVTDHTDQLIVHCSRANIEIALYVDTGTLDPALRGTQSGYLAIVLDGSDAVSFVPGKLITDSGRTSIGVGGSAAKELTHRIAAATRSVEASILTDAPRPERPRYNRVQFPADGAADAIKAAYAGCGIAY